MLPTFAYAAPAGGISGVIRDQTGATLGHAKITLIRLGTNATMSTESDSQGLFQFVQLAPDVYRMVIEEPGFKSVTLDRIEVLVDQITHQGVSLVLGSSSDSITVEATAPLVEKEQSTISNVIESKAITTMPLNSRNFLDLALLTPGATPSASGNVVSGFNVAGARTQSNDYLIDGVSNMDTQENSGLSSFRINDAIQEFSIQTSVPTAEFGRGQGAQLNAVTRSGSNQLHGSAFEYFRNTVLDATDFFTKRNGAPKATVNRNQFGATLGGPILKDKTFFFLSFEGFRQAAPTVSTILVPTPAQRASVTDPISQQLLKFWPQQQYPLSASGTNYTSNVPGSLVDNTGLVRIDHNLAAKDKLSGHYIIYRGSSVTGGATPLSGGDTNQPASTSTEVEENHIFSPTFLNTLRFGYSMTATVVKVQDFGFNAARVFLDANGQPLPGVVDGSSNLQDSGLPTISINGGFAALGAPGNLPQARTNRTYELFDTMTSSGLSNHIFKWGAHVRREDLRQYLDSDSRGAVSFASFSDFANGLINTSTIRTGSTLAHWRRFPADFFWQDQYKARENLTVNYGIRYELPSAIYELNGRGSDLVPGQGITELGTNEVVNINPALEGPSSIYLTPGSTSLRNSGVAPDKNNVAPVVGFAWSPHVLSWLFGHDENTVIRGGFRVGYDDMFANIPADQALDAPFNITTTQTAGVTQPGKFDWATAFSQQTTLVKNFGQQGPGTPTVGVLTFFGIDPAMRSSYNYAYNLNIARQISGTWSIETSYIGSVGRKLGVYLDRNEPVVTPVTPTPSNSATYEQTFPYNQYGPILTGSGAGSSSYNGVVITTKYRGRQGITLQSSYTLSHSLDTSSAYFGSTGSNYLPSDSRNLGREYGNSAFDMRQRFVTYYVVPLPIGPGHAFLNWDNLASREIFNGWLVSGIATAQSGMPFTTYLGSIDYSGFNQFADRPNILGSGRLTQNNHNPNAAFDTTYFSTSIAPGTVGTERRDQYYGPGMVDFDLSGSKDFDLSSDRYKLQFRTDVFNLFNHTNFANPIGTVSSASFGKITSTIAGASSTSGGPTGGARLVQFSLRLNY